MKNMTLANWLTNNNYAYVEEAEMYEIGQMLTMEKAMHVREIMVQSYIDSHDNYVQDRMVAPSEFVYEEFFCMLLDLMEAEDNAWFGELVKTFGVQDHRLWYWIDKDRKYQEEADEIEKFRRCQDEADEMEDTE